MKWKNIMKDNDILIIILLIKGYKDVLYSGLGIWQASNLHKNITLQIDQCDKAIILLKNIIRNRNA